MIKIYFFFAPDLEFISESTDNCVFLIVPFLVGNTGHVTHKIGREGNDCCWYKKIDWNAVKACPCSNAHRPRAQNEVLPFL